MAEPGQGYSGQLLVGQLRRELDRLFHELLATSETLSSPTSWAPPLDVIERAGEVLVLVEVPGLGVDDVSVEVVGAALRISGSRELTFQSADDVRFHCIERQEGSFTRRVEIGQPVDFAKAEAILRRGLLVVTLPKIADRRIGVRVIAVDEETEADDGT